MPSDIACSCIAGCLLWVACLSATAAACPLAASGGQDAREPADDAAMRLEAALALAARPHPTHWRATFVESTFVREKGRPENPTDRESGLVIGTPRGFLVEKSVSPNGVIGSLAVLHGPSMLRTADGLAVYASPPPFLCNLASIAPTVEALRSAGMVPREYWDRVSVRVEDGRAVYEVTTKPRPGLAREEYVLTFEPDDRAGRLSGFAWRVWSVAKEGEAPPLASEVDVQVEAWARIGEADVPSRMTRMTYVAYPGEAPPPRVVQRIELAPAPMPAEDADAALKAGSTPRHGELVRDLARSAEYRCGEAWIKVGGVEFDLEDPIEGIPESIPDLLRRAKAPSSR